MSCPKPPGEAMRRREFIGVIAVLGSGLAAGDMGSAAANAGDRVSQILEG